MGIDYYTPAFFAELQEGAGRSASVIVPLVLRLLPARSVVDVGCGQGDWLAEFCKWGVDDFLGVDGDYVERDALRIPVEKFKSMDLSRPLAIDRTFDLAVSLEVAEHLDPSCAESFVESLTRLAPVVLFSAAIPYQGGTHHVNEQWPDAWADSFGRCGYVPVDCIRWRIWENPAVEWWYAQNILFFVRSDFLQRTDSLRSEHRLSAQSFLRVVHPRNYLSALQPVTAPSWNVLTAWRLFLLCFRNAVKRRLRMLFRIKWSDDVRNPPNFSLAVQGARCLGTVKKLGRDGNA